jgi:hypothetical protein
MKKPEKSAASPVDRTIFRLLTAGWERERVTQYDKHIERYASLPAAVTDAFAAVDAKATGLLTHVSLMIAGLGLIAPLVADDQFEEGVVIAEIAVYLLLAVGCLRCLAAFNSRVLGEGGAALTTGARNELIIRRELYALCNRAAIWFTLLVFLLLPALFFYRPEHTP